MAFKYTDVVFKLRAFQYAGFSFGCIDKAVLNTLATHANAETGQCWPGYGLIAKEVITSRSSVIRAIAKLEKLGFVTISSDPARSTHTYTLDMDKMNEAIDGFAFSPKKQVKVDGKTCSRSEKYRCVKPVEDEDDELAVADPINEA